MYDKKFAEIYNEDWAFFSEKRARVILERTSARGALLDLGCGTGNFLRAVEKEFGRTVGVDASPYMIDIARKNCIRSELFVGDVLKFEPQGKFDLITCNFDMINHLADIGQYKRLFRRVAAALTEDGEFIFDFNTRGEFAYLDREVREEGKKFVRVFKDSFVDDEHVRINIRVLDRIGGEQVAELDVVESLYDAEPMREALASAGLGKVEFVDEDLLPARDLTASRLFARCKLGST